MRKFWMVYRSSGIGGSPTVKHNLEVEARGEARRLAAKHNDEFCVLECIGSMKPVLPIEWNATESI